MASWRCWFQGVVIDFLYLVESYLEMACSIAVLGGGSNKEYALHVLHRVNGNIKVICMLTLHSCLRLC